MLAQISKQVSGWIALVLSKKKSINKQIKGSYYVPSRIIWKHMGDTVNGFEEVGIS